MLSIFRLCRVPWSGPCVVNILPANTLFQIVNTCTTTVPSVKRARGVNKRIDRNLLEISVRCRSATRAGKTRSPSLTRLIYLLQFLNSVWKREASEWVRTLTLSPNVVDTLSPVEIAETRNRRSRDIAGKEMKPSQKCSQKQFMHAGEEERKMGCRIARRPVIQIALSRGWCSEDFLTSIGILPTDGSVPLFRPVAS